jgi:hypothetical protein
MPELSTYLSRFHTLSPASDELIAEYQGRIGLKLPAAYISFLKLTNGGDGFIGSNYVAFWCVEELTRFKSEHAERDSVWSDLLVIGTDGRNKTYAFDIRTNKWPVVEIPWSGSEWEDARTAGGSFDGFLRRLYETE